MVKKQEIIVTVTRQYRYKTYGTRLGTRLAEKIAIQDLCKETAFIEVNIEKFKIESEIVS